MNIKHGCVDPTKKEKQRNRERDLGMFTSWSSTTSCACHCIYGFVFYSDFLRQTCTIISPRLHRNENVTPYFTHCGSLLIKDRTRRCAWFKAAS